MTYFNDCETPHPCLEIVENKSDSHAQALTLKVHPPVIGAFPLVRKLLETSLHLTEWSAMETKDVMDNFLGKIMTEKRKHKDLSDQHHEFADLDSISIDTAVFEDGAAGSTMPFADLAHQLDLVDVSSNIFSDDVFGEDCFTSPNPSSVLKSPNLSLDNAMTQASNKDPLVKLPKNIESFQNVPTTDMVAEANDNRPSNVPKDLVNVVDFYSLEVLLTDIFKKYGGYDIAKFSGFQKITRNAHQELLSVMQHHLHAANEDKVKMDKHLAELQKVLDRARRKRPFCLLKNIKRNCPKIKKVSSTLKARFMPLRKSAHYWKQKPKGLLS
ncbi:hypothetical protein BC332_03865 [Capsicum chinense]|nr:hypothetical protein BC332_03865 [Capsicum chinense]